MAFLFSSEWFIIDISTINFQQKKRREETPTDQMFKENKQKEKNNHQTNKSSESYVHNIRLTNGNQSCELLNEIGWYLTNKCCILPSQSKKS